MQKTGTIQAINPKGSYQAGSGKTIYTFDVTVMFPDGVQTGEIGSVAQVYPTAVGSEIIVDVTVNEHGVRFKKVNPAGGGNYNGSGGGGGRSGSYKGSDPVAITRSVALKASVELVSSGKVDYGQLTVVADGLVDWLNERPDTENSAASNDCPI